MCTYLPKRVLLLLCFLILAGEVLSNCLQANKDVMRLIKEFAQNRGVYVLILSDLMDEGS